jgi:hypothetical protein
MPRAHYQNSASPPGGYRGPQGLGERAALALEQSAGAGQGIGAVEEAACLRRWSQIEGVLIAEPDWLSLDLITNATAEHEVRYRLKDHRAVKRTWPDTYGMVPEFLLGAWRPQPATPRQYLLRQALQNELFDDSIRLEGTMEGLGPSMIIGQPAGGLSLVISQAWLNARDPSDPHPSESEIAGLLEERGFSRLAGSFFGWEDSDAGLIILDAKADNFISTTHGILPIDLLLTHCTPPA